MGGGRTTLGIGGGIGINDRCCLFSLRCINLMRSNIRERRRRRALLSISRVEATYEFRVTRKAELTCTNCITCKWKERLNWLLNKRRNVNKKILTSSGGMLAPIIIISSGRVGTTRGSLIFIFAKTPLFSHLKKDFQNERLPQKPLLSLTLNNFPVEWKSLWLFNTKIYSTTPKDKALLENVDCVVRTVLKHGKTNATLNIEALVQNNFPSARN